MTDKKWVNFFPLIEKANAQIRSFNTFDTDTETGFVIKTTQFNLTISCKKNGRCTLTKGGNDYDSLNKIINERIKAIYVIKYHSAAFADVKILHVILILKHHLYFRLKYDDKSDYAIRCESVADNDYRCLRCLSPFIS